MSPLNPLLRVARCAAVLFAIVALAGCAGSASESATDSGAASSETEVQLELLSGQFDTIQGGQIDFASLDGQDTVLWFWAPW